MSGKKNRVRGQSGLLTGLMIVSTGLIAGFHGFELAMSDQNSLLSKSSNSDHNTQYGNERSQRAVNQQVRNLDKIITASLEQGPSSRDRQGLANLIQSAQFQPDHSATATDNAPRVNRAMKRDRAPVTWKNQHAYNSQKSQGNYGSALTAFINAANSTKAPTFVAPARNPGKVDAEQRELTAGDEAGAPVVKAALNSEIPFADSADIALFAADMPLPAKLVRINQPGKTQLLSRSYGTPYRRSPLIPRKFISGKAFGGLAERAFQKRERRCMTTALYFEARSEPEAGQIAVGQVIMNRVRSPDYPDTICGVIYQGSHRRTGCQFSFTCDGKADKPNNRSQWERSKRLADDVLEGKVWLKSIGDATHYHATYVKPRWRRKMARIRRIGRHIFYKSPKVSVTETYQRYASGQRS